MNNLIYGSFRKKSSQSVLYEGEYVESIGMHGGIKWYIIMLQPEYRNQFILCKVLLSSKEFPSIFINDKNRLTLLLNNSD